MSRISRLPQDTINRIAAGEVVERPSSAVKELVENALDAGATQIDIRCDLGGLSRIIVEDNGHGMGAKDLALCVERHATSKLKPKPDGSWDLLHIQTLGFRGEALPSMGSVARLSLTSRILGADHALNISVDAGLISPLKPAAFGLEHGTRIELSDLFYATPARLKFMKSERSENMAIVEEVKRQAMSRQEVGFSLSLDGKKSLKLSPQTPDFEGRLARLTELLGSDFSANSLLLDQVREGVRLTGYAGLPTFSRGNGLHQYLFVNNRPVRDKLLAGALRAAYADFLARDRHPLAALYLEIDPQDLDVNVHPAKTEVRFRDPALVRGMIIGSLKHALASAGHRASTTVSHQTLRGFTAHHSPYQPSFGQHYQPVRQDFTSSPSHAQTLDFAPSARMELQAQNEHSFDYEVSEASEPSPFTAPNPLEQHPLGAARAQIHETYIIAQTLDGLIIVDQHAAHERLMYERMKSAMKQGNVATQTLLIPEIVDLDPSEVERLMGFADELQTYGLGVERFGAGSVLVRTIPALLGNGDTQGLIRDLVDEITEHGHGLSLKERMANICGDIACRYSIRAGRRLNADEMNALLRQMEETPHSGQCNHGRPTYVELKLKDIEKLFGRR